MADKVDIREFPDGYTGRKTYVTVRGHGIVACCYTYRGGDGRNYLHPDFGGDYSGVSNRSDTIKLPYLMRDIGEYQSPIDGKVIRTRSEHRDHLKAHDVIEVGNERVGAARPEPMPRQIGETIKRRLEQVKAMPQKQYNEEVKAHAHGN